MESYKICWESTITGFKQCGSYISYSDDKDIDSIISYLNFKFPFIKHKAVKFQNTSFLSKFINRNLYIL